jgi:hypothetical protein
MAMLGQDMPQAPRGGMAAPAGASSGAYGSGMGSGNAGSPPQGDGSADAPGNVVNPVNLLRGILGR